MMFEMSDELRLGDERAFEALKYCIRSGVMISREVARWLCANHDELIIDEGYDDFEDSTRWSIAKYYIIVLDGDAYRFWEWVGLTEMQPNEWYDQTFEPVVQRTVSVVQWQTIDEINEYLKYMENYKGV